MKNLVLLICFSSILQLSRAQTDCFGEGLPTNVNTRSVLKGADNFGIDMFKDIALKHPRNSIVVSGYSVSSVLNLAYFGSAGTTETQLQNALGVNSKSDAYYGGHIIEQTLQLYPGTIFNKADKAYFDKSMQLQDCAMDKLPNVERIDFKDANRAAITINRDVSRATNGKITRFLSPDIIRNARFVLLNAIYFKGIWRYQFKPESTVESPFYDEARTRSKGNVKMMTNQAKLRYANSASLGAQILELPYQDSNISMLIILPQKGNTVNKVLKDLNSDAMDKVNTDLRLRKVAVKIPRWKMTTRVATELKDALKTLGITDLFDPSRANLSKFIASETAYVDEAMHHATIEVSEEGTVATAATGLIGTRSGAADMVFVNAERPFIFTIRDMSQGLTLFMGVYRDPSQAEEF